MYDVHIRSQIKRLSDNQLIQQFIWIVTGSALTNQEKIDMRDGKGKKITAGSAVTDEDQVVKSITDKF